jgi:hypothetical protein
MQVEGRVRTTSSCPLELVLKFITRDSQPRTMDSELIFWCGYSETEHERSAVRRVELAIEAGFNDVKPLHYCGCRFYHFG